MTLREALLTVGDHLETLGIRYAFLGASVLPFLVDHPEILDIRPTVDIDLSIEIGSLSAFYRLEEALRQRGFRNDAREGAPICRWIIDGVTVDIMPTEGRVLGIGSEWFREAASMPSGGNSRQAGLFLCSPPPISSPPSSPPFATAEPLILI